MQQELEIISKENKPRIIVCALDIKIAYAQNNYNKTEFETKAYAKWISLSPTEKLKIIVHHIEKICEKYKKTEPDSLWLIVGKEYFITDTDDQYVLSHDFKKDIDLSMTRLVEKFKPNLYILSGSMLFKKTVPFNEKKARENYARFDKYSQKTQLQYKKLYEKYPYLSSSCSFIPSV